MNTARPLAVIVPTLAALALAAGGSAGQIVPDWVTTHVTGDDFGPRSLAVDAAGRSYVLSQVVNTTDDMVLTMFDAEGVLVWEQVYDGSGQEVALSAVLSADESAVFAVGRSSGDYKIIKYDAASGAQLWQQSYNGPAGSTDDPRAAAAMPDGGIVVTGRVWNGNERFDFGTVRLDAAGTIMWTATFGDNGPFLFNDDSGEVVTVTADGDVVVSGFARPASSGNDVVTFRYDGQTGAQEWMARYSTSADESVRDIAMTPDGDVIVFGLDPFGWDRQWLIIRYDGLTGGPEWTTLYDPGSDETATSVTVDAAGDVYVTGATDPDADDGNFNQNLVVIALEGATGAVRWLAEFGSEGINDADFGLDLMTDGLGHLYVFGSSRSDFVVQNPFDADAIVLEYDTATGTLLDMGGVDTTEEGGFTMTDTFIAAGRDAAGRMYAVGISDGDVFVDSRMLLARFTETSPSVPGDVDGDGVVNVADIVAVILAWGPCPGGCAADLTGDGRVNVEDLVAVITNWT